MFHPEAERLGSGFIAHFWSADHSIRWSSAEQEMLQWLDERTALVGRVDARGTTEGGDNFFGEWKTMNERRARYMAAVKEEWRFDPQALTYGVLVPNTRMFTVRWAIKSNPAKFDHEWYTYTDAEVEWWRGELIRIAQDIRRNRERGGRNWPTNLTNCLRYGAKYACPFLNDCQALTFASAGTPREPHLGIERELRAIEIPGLVVLDATRTETWLGCQEKYRRTYEGTGHSEESEALTIGKDFHTIISTHINKLIDAQTVKAEELSLG